MFYHLEGIVSEFGQNLVVIDCGGVGFAVNASVQTISQLKTGEKAKLYISEAIGESNFDLYGFCQKEEKRCFEMLISVSGIGPKAAMSILSYSSPESLALAIMNDDVKALTVAPGVGKKIAQRVILELKDKISKESSIVDFSSPALQAVSAAPNSQVNDAMAGLAVLGYSSAEIAPIIKQIDTASLSAEQIIKLVLKQLVE